MKKIAIATATRAEYGILHPLLVRLMEEKEFDVQLLVTGTHLEEQFGYTVKEIEKDGIPTVSYTHLTLPTICSV